MKGTNPYPHIVVETYADLPEAQALAADAGRERPEPGWPTIGKRWRVVGVGLVSLLMLRSMVRSPARRRRRCRPQRPATPRSRGWPCTSQPADDDEPEPLRVLKTTFRVSGPDLKAELQDIVKENPDAAATILRSWIGEAA